MGDAAAGAAACDPARQPQVTAAAGRPGSWMLEGSNARRRQGGVPGVAARVP